ncbi:hypothetical protein DFJ43DRAFT_1103031 [Lentinula guzmanii]|uniref:Uncharacterized protein n=1 Tax=Lentinula guzmanii TaxID=2804957 RepID=A0AA38MQW7_9AGAR|nr:hypothetical protein DFJ43DRAFT_1103031 [Lentinula guzmanii]
MVIIDHTKLQCCCISTVRMNSQDLPPLPRIEDTELFMTVYTHHSLSTGPYAETTYRDSGRLAEVGEKVLDLTVTDYLYRRKPVIDAQSIRKERRDILADETIIQWLNLYNLKAKLRAADPTILQDPQEMRKYFLAYVGAVFVSNDILTVQNWIVRLIDPLDSQGFPSKPPQYNAPHPAPPQSSPPSFPPIYVPPASSMTSTSGAPPNLSWLTLSVVNQAAAQKRMRIHYQPTRVGADHSPTWTVQCFINDQERGVGTGKNQKLAREEAARKAYAPSYISFE